MSSVSQRVLSTFKQRGISFELFEHAPVRTSEEASRVRGVPLKTGVKAMLMRNKKGLFVLVLLPADRKIDVKQIEKLENNGQIELAKPEEVERVTGCVPGSVPPFAHETALKTYFHRAILENELVNFNIGEHTLSVRIKSSDL